MSNLKTVYTRINWENQPSTKTALGATNLNKIDLALSVIDNRVVEIDTAKLDTETANSLVQNVTINKQGIFTITKMDGSIIQYDTALEKIAVNFNYNADTQQIILTLEDGSQQYIDLSALITEFEFLPSDTIDFSVSEGKVSAEVRDHSITEKKLQPNYLADIKIHLNRAEEQAALSKSYAHGQTGIRPEESTDNSWYYSQQAKNYMEAAQAASKLVVPQFYIDFSTGCLMSETEASGINFTIKDGCFMGEVTANAG